MPGRYAGHVWAFGRAQIALGCHPDAGLGLSCGQWRTDAARFRATGSPGEDGITRRGGRHARWVPLVDQPAPQTGIARGNPANSPRSPEPSRRPLRAVCGPWDGPAAQGASPPGVVSSAPSVLWRPRPAVLSAATGEWGEPQGELRRVKGLSQARAEEP